MFRDRKEAGELLAETLGVYRRAPGALVLGIPRGGVVVAAAVSVRLDLPLDVAIARKLKGPLENEPALGAVAEGGAYFLDHAAIDAANLPFERLENEIHRERLDVEWRRRLYRGGRPLPMLSARTVLLVDDGIMGGATFFSAAMSLRTLSPKTLIAAVPVCPAPALRALEKLVDGLAVLESPPQAGPLARHYETFEPVSDASVLECLCYRQGALGARRAA